MKNQIMQIITIKGYKCIYQSIDKTIQDLERLGDSKQEIKEFINDKFGGFDFKLDSYINSKF